MAPQMLASAADSCPFCATFVSRIPFPPAHLPDATNNSSTPGRPKTRISVQPLSLSAGANMS
jgi:hypothetical protein